jgi:hypothetical protein
VQAGSDIVCYLLLVVWSESIVLASDKGLAPQRSPYGTCAAPFRAYMMSRTRAESYMHENVRRFSNADSVMVQYVDSP